MGKQKMAKFSNILLFTFIICVHFTINTLENKNLGHLEESNNAATEFLEEENKEESNVEAAEELEEENTEELEEENKEEDTEEEDEEKGIHGGHEWHKKHHSG